MKLITQFDKDGVLEAMLIYNSDGHRELRVWRDGVECKVERGLQELKSGDTDEVFTSIGFYVYELGQDKPNHFVTDHWVKGFIDGTMKF